MRIASRMRVTPSAVTSPVSTGCEKLVITKLCAARLYTSVGRCSLTTEIIDPSSSRSPVTSVMSSWMCAMRSNVTVELRRAMPTTS